MVGWKEKESGDESPQSKGSTGWEAHRTGTAWECDESAQSKGSMGWEAHRTGTGSPVTPETG